MIPQSTRAVLDAALAAGLPGAALGVVDASGQRDTVVLGLAQREPTAEPLGADHFFDLASLTKPLFTAREVLRAVADGLLDLDDELGHFLPELAWMQDTPLRSRTLRQLLTHTAGLPAWAPVYTWGDAATIRARIIQEAWPMQEPGEVVYSDLGYMLLGRVLERVHGRPLRDFALDDGLTFAPDPALSVATERCAWRERMLRGEVHDENAGSLGGVSGHAGLFGTLAGVLRHAELILRGGWLPPAAQDAALRPAAPGRTLTFVQMQPGWSGGSLAGPNAVGHTGFTGTGVWVDHARGLGWALLTNRVHPTRHSGFDIQGLRRAVGNTLLAAQH
ncbi:CubicO group peptidase (beta-lactamase class C family) [Deinococcus metalli]|uniref:CubicO group peptidase (Beta-lactamase class C family) n=1 Tax=Deinococcus metalli TaxID=1141878 RepID=A0A7W8KCY6_9DEIO|nr:serine hydrolase domain-containing protein [Deinococcus metalli]MBB5375912.1 CubicO group peptidase (beta-lactamase class C family) [Deinococcus metalli]GHF36131.1 esterase [Deinococcus metalli]